MTASSGPQRDATSRRRFLAAAGTAAAVPAAAALIAAVRWAAPPGQRHQAGLPVTRRYHRAPSGLRSTRTATSSATSAATCTG